MIEIRFQYDETPELPMKTNHLLAIAALTIGLLVAGCGKHASKTAPPPPVVSVVQPVAREVVEWDEYIGRLESPETVELRARVSGYLDKVHFKEGKEIKKGDLLFTIDPRPYQAEFDRVDAEHQRAESQADLAKSDAERAKNLSRRKPSQRKISTQRLKPTRRRWQP